MTQPTKWTTPLGSGADVQDLPDDDLRYASFSKIFPQITQVPLSAGGVAPRRIDFNSLFKLLADNIYYYQNGGVFEYSDTADYEKGALVRYNDKIYLCIQDNSALNTHNPEDMGYWLRVALNNELADYLPLAGGNLTGNLTVQNKNVVRSVNGVDANEIGNVQLGNIGGITGEIKWFAFNTPPDGYLVCNGATVSRETYADLFAVIGTTFGSGDGSTTFTLPNLIDKFAQGSTTVGTVKSAGLPNITGGHSEYVVSETTSKLSTSYGALKVNISQNNIFGSSSSTGATYGFNFEINASNANGIYGNSETVQPPALTLLPCIKY